MSGVVGASIVSIITESLYDKPLVVFREYIQNAVDAMTRTSDNFEYLSAHMWLRDGNLYFLDNGSGIPKDAFERKMTSIARSDKIKKDNIGYKGIGRLSGLPYCQNLSFINILDYKNNIYQEYFIDGAKYMAARKREDFNQMTFEFLMNEIGTLSDSVSHSDISSIIDCKKSLFEHRNTGFLVILENISSVLLNTIKEPKFIQNLSWLLPVPFKEAIANEELVQPLSADLGFGEDYAIPAKAYAIYFDGKQLFRPLEPGMLRTYLCRSDFSHYAVCLHSFSNKKIVIDSSNPFSGIRIYIDNMLLCDENELIPALQQYGLTNHSLYELIQTVRGIGAMIFIVDKINISANARRTFIDVTNEDSLDFLALIGEFVESVYRARYALSDYNTGKNKENAEHQKLQSLKEKAQASLELLARETVFIEEEPERPSDFSLLSKTEKKKIIKSKISKEFNAVLKRYLSQVEDFSPENCFEDFKTWLSAN